MDILYNIELDFSNNNYQLVKAKQGDSKSRFIKITCTNNGEPVVLNPDNHSVYVRYKKPDNYLVMNQCEITEDGGAAFELTNQMLVSVGVAYVDVVIYNTPTPVFNDQGEIQNDEETSILSTMNFSVEIIPQPLTGDNIQSSDEFKVDDSISELLIHINEARVYINQINEAKPYVDQINNAKPYIDGIMETQRQLMEKIEYLEDMKLRLDFDDGHIYYEIEEPDEEPTEELVVDPGGNPDDGSSDNTGDSTGDNTGDNTGEDTGDNTGDNTGNTSGEGNTEGGGTSGEGGSEEPINNDSSTETEGWTGTNEESNQNDGQDGSDGGE